MKIVRQDLFDAAEDLGFDPQPLEKVLRLKHLLSAFQEHRDLRDQLVLKGGTALNLFYLDLLRMSVDIDLNFVGESEKPKMLEKRKTVESAIEGVFQREGYQIASRSDSYAGTFWKLTYQRAVGGRDTIKVDLNFLMRVPLFPPQNQSPFQMGFSDLTSFPVLDLHELAGGKFRALLDRIAGRDLFDVYHLFTTRDLNRNSFRIAFTVYGASSAEIHDWREVSPEHIDYDLDDIKYNLLFVLREELQETIEDPKKWAQKMVEQCRAELDSFLPFSDRESEFLYNVIEKGRIRPELMTEDEKLQKNIKNNPALRWKIQNVRDHNDENGVG